MAEAWIGSLKIGIVGDDLKDASAVSDGGEYQLGLSALATKNR
jgi:hypothetical protein